MTVATDNETLYLATKSTRYGTAVIGKPLLFRTRKAARDFARDYNKKHQTYRYRVSPAKWGPGQ